MPLKSLKQELYMRQNETTIWRKWVKNYGHAQVKKDDKRG